MENDALQALSLLVVKRGVALGGLYVREQARVFALVWAGLPESAMSERQINVELQAQLASAVAFLDTDHVELRRWLVDAGWLQRDGWGREYRRSPQPPAAAQPLAQLLDAMDVAAWVTGQRAAHEARRQARRLAWQQQPPQ